MEKITKKRFREIIENNTTALIGNCPLSKMSLAELDEYATSERVDAIPMKNWRTVESKHSNHVVFSNNSRLDFQVGYEFYQRDNLLFVLIPGWQTMVYLVA